MTDDWWSALGADGVGRVWGGGGVCWDGEVMGITVEGL